MKYQSLLLTESDLELAMIVRDLLKPFLFVTNLLSTERTTTLDLVLHSCLYIRHKIASFQHSNEYSKNFKLLLLNSFNFYIEKYEIFTYPLLVSAGFLNPQYRLS